MGLKNYLKRNLDIFGGSYSIKELMPAIERSGYSEDDVLNAIHAIKHPKTKVFASLVVIILFSGMVFAFSQPAGAEDFKILAVASNLIERPITEHNTTETIQNVTLNILYEYQNLTINKTIKAVIGDEICLDEQKHVGCGIIPIAYVDKQGIQRVALTEKGRTMLNFLPDTSWTLAQETKDGVLFDTIFTLPKRTLAEFNSIVHSDVENNLSVVYRQK